MGRSELLPTVSFSVRPFLGNQVGGNNPQETSDSPASKIHKLPEIMEPFEGFKGIVSILFDSDTSPPLEVLYHLEFLMYDGCSVTS